MAAFSFTRAVPPPSSSHALLCHPSLYSKTYENFEGQRKKRSFRFQDSSLASLVRMYEMVLCGLGKQLAQEAEYFATQKWQVKDIPDPTRVGWEHDLERERVLQALAIILIDALNDQILSDEGGISAGGLHSVPKWAQPLLDYSVIEDLYLCYPTLGHAYFYLPWRALSFVHPPRCPRTIMAHAPELRRNYRHRDKLISIPIFVESDNVLTSLCRAYELHILTDVFPEMINAFYDEMDYFMSLLGPGGLKDIPDPRTRWERMSIKEPEAFRGLVQFIKEINEMHLLEGQSLPSWVIYSLANE